MLFDPMFATNMYFPRVQIEFPAIRAPAGTISITSASCGFVNPETDDAVVAAIASVDKLPVGMNANVGWRVHAGEIRRNRWNGLNQTHVSVFESNDTRPGSTPLVNDEHVRPAPVKCRVSGRDPGRVLKALAFVNARDPDRCDTRRCDRPRVAGKHETVAGIEVCRVGMRAPLRAHVDAVRPLKNATSLAGSSVPSGFTKNSDTVPSSKKVSSSGPPFFLTTRMTGSASP